MGTVSDYLAANLKERTASNGAATSSPADGVTERLQANIRKYGLAENIIELETNGLTVVPPEKAAPAGFCDRLRDGVLRFIEKHDGQAPDFETGEGHKNQVLGDYHYLILHDPVFQEMLCQPVAVTLLDYLLGENAIVHTNTAICKGPHDEMIPGSDLVLPLHSDNYGMPGPFHAHAELANLTWTLSEYSKENGALAYVPGSHLLRRHPLASETLSNAVPVNAAPGSLICWHANTWHGAYRRTAPGLRLSMAGIYSRPHIWPRHPLRDDVTQEILDANPPRFAKFCGRHVMTGWREEGPAYDPELISDYPTRFH